MTPKPVQFRPYEPSDRGALQRLANNPRIAANLTGRFPHPYTLADADAWITLNADKEPQTNMAITVGGAFAGGIGVILGQDIYARSGEIGYWLGEPFWGRGIATRAVTDFTRWVATHFDLVRIVARVFAPNVASARVLEKADYTLEARHVRAVFKRGILMDELLYVRFTDDITP